jgi:putative Holliday junction resolvase
MPAYLGIDYGTKRIGLAWADELGIALPVGAISGIEIEGCWDQLAEEINSRKIDELVVGYPLHMDGKVGKRAEEVDQFIDRLSELFSLPVHRVDERLTSMAAEESIGKKAKTKKGKQSGKVDATAACLILRDFLQGQSVNK